MSWSAVAAFPCHNTYRHVGWPVVCDCGITWSYSLTMMWVGLQCVIAAFPGHTHSDLGWSVVSDCGISWSYSLSLMLVGLQCVIVAFPGHTHLQ